MNVLDAAGVPRVMSLAEVLEAYLAHRMEVLVRRSRHRLAKVEDRLEVLEGYLKAFLDLDEVIRIIREEDEPKPALMARFELTDRQAEAILNLRLRNLRKLEEMELAAEQARLSDERRSLLELLADEGDGLRRARLKEQFLAAQEAVRRRAALGKRRTSLAEAPVIAPELLEEPVERFPVTIVCSKLGWIRSVRGAVENPAELKYKEGDGERFVLPAQSSDRLLVLAADGRVYTLGRRQALQRSRATASRSRWRSTWRRASRSWTCASTAPTAGWCSRPARASASWPRSRRSPPRPAPASRWST